MENNLELAHLYTALTDISIKVYNFNTSIQNLSSSFNEKIDNLSGRIDGVEKSLNEKIDNLEISFDNKLHQSINELKDEISDYMINDISPIITDNHKKIISSLEKFARTRGYPMVCEDDNVKYE